jgi:hypothetical protein
MLWGKIDLNMISTNSKLVKLITTTHTHMQNLWYTNCVLILLYWNKKSSQHCYMVGTHLIICATFTTLLIQSKPTHLAFIKPKWKLYTIMQRGGQKNIKHDHHVSIANLVALWMYFGLPIMLSSSVICFSTIMSPI